MADNTSAGSIRTLDTKEFNGVREKFKQASQDYIDARQKLDSATTTLLSSWHGEGRRTFEHKYNLFSGKLDDLQEVIKDYSDSFGNVLTSYEDADREIANQLSAALENSQSSNGTSGIGGGGDSSSRF